MTTVKNNFETVKEFTSVEMLVLQRFFNKVWITTLFEDNQSLLQYIITNNNEFKEHSSVFVAASDEDRTLIAEND